MRFKFHQLLIRFSLFIIAMVLYLSLIVVGTSASGTATLTAPYGAEFTGGNLIVGDNLGTSTAGSVAATGTSGWTLDVADTKTETTGFMTIGGDDDASKKLANPIQVGMTAGNEGNIASYQNALQADTADGYGANGTFSIPLYFKQTIIANDKAGAYKITLTYTVTPQ